MQACTTPPGLDRGAVYITQNVLWFSELLHIQAHSALMGPGRRFRCSCQWDTYLQPASEQVQQRDAKQPTTAWHSTLSGLQFD